MRKTLKHVAEVAGVSASTVSRALAGQKGVSEDTRHMIFRIAEELKYRPDELARGLVRSSSNTIGGLILEFSNPFFVSVIEAIEAKADERDYIAVIGETRRQLSLETRLVERLRSIRVAGYIITPVLESIDHLLAVRAEGIPVIVVGRSCPGLDYVCADNMAGAIMVAEHLVRLGHRRIAYVCSGEPFNEPELTRLEALVRALAEAGTGLPADYVLHVGNNCEKGGLIAGARILELWPRPSAVFASTDRLAIGVIHYLRMQDVQVPEDVAVVGYDDIPTAEYCEVPLTSVSYPKYEMGKLAARMLFERIDGTNPKDVEQIRLQPELVVRQSCGFHLSSREEKGGDAHRQWE